MIELTKVTIATHTVPGTDVTITIVHEPRTTDAATLRYYPHRVVDCWTVTRNPGTASFVNYLMTGRSSLAMARAEANLLWSDTVARRDASPF